MGRSIAEAPEPDRYRSVENRLRHALGYLNNLSGFVTSAVCAASRGTAMAGGML